jgi:quinol monooxygenase YgiN
MPQAQPGSFIDQLRAQVSAMLNKFDQAMPIEATVTFPVDRTKESTFIRNADVLTEATRKLPGCLFFGYHKQIPESIAAVPDAAIVGYEIVERWRSVYHFQFQWASPELICFQHAVVDLIKGAPDLRWYYGSDYSAEARVAQTGQKQCWDSSGTFINCLGTGQDGEIQAGVPWPAPRFIDNEDGTVTDNLTGLIWLKNADGFGEVTWAQALTNAHNLASGSSGLTDGSVAGDWRLPNIRELFSLIDYGTGDPCLPAGHPFTDVKSAIYWTGTTLRAAPTLAWMMTLGIAPTVFDLKINANRMWPVRSGDKVRVAQTGQKQCWDTDGNLIDCTGTGQDGEIQAGVPWPTRRFSDNQNGTVTDNLTGLVWLKNADNFGFRTWAQALAVCNSLASGSYGLTDGSVAGDWRLPNVKEIESLVDYDQVGPCLPPGHPFVNVRPSSYWTATSVQEAPTQAMFIIFGVGPIIFENKEHPFFVWPVRDWRPAQ